MAAPTVQRRLGRDRLAATVWRPWALVDPADHLVRRTGPCEGAGTRGVRRRVRARWPDAGDVGERGAEGLPPTEDAQRRGARVAGVLRAGVRLRPRTVVRA